MHCKERAIPGLCIGNGGVGVPDLCVNVCVIDDLRCTAPTLQLMLWLQPCDTRTPAGIALLVCLLSASWIMSL